MAYANLGFKTNKTKEKESGREGDVGGEEILLNLTDSHGVSVL